MILYVSVHEGAGYTVALTSNLRTQQPLDHMFKRLVTPDDGEHFYITLQTQVQPVAIKRHCELRLLNREEGLWS